MIPPLVDQKTWELVQARIADGAQYIPRPGSEYLLSGLAQCGYCEGAMSGGVDRRGSAGATRPGAITSATTSGARATLSAPISITSARTSWSSG